MSLLEKEQSTFLLLHDFIVMALCYFVTENVYFRENMMTSGVSFHTVSY